MGSLIAFFNTTHRRIAELALDSVTSHTLLKAPLFPSVLPLLAPGSLLGMAAAQRVSTPLPLPPAARPAWILLVSCLLPVW